MATSVALCPLAGGCGRFLCVGGRSLCSLHCPPSGLGPESRGAAYSVVLIREGLPLLPVVSPPGWVASRVIKLPPARACLQLAPQRHASHTSHASKLPRPTGNRGQGESSVKLTGPRTLPPKLCPLGRLLFGGEEHRGFQLELCNRKKLFLLIQNSLESITVLPKLPRYRGGNSLDSTMHFSRQIVITTLMTEKL